MSFIVEKNPQNHNTFRLQTSHFNDLKSDTFSWSIRSKKTNTKRKIFINLSNCSKCAIYQLIWIVVYMTKQYEQSKFVILMMSLIYIFSTFSFFYIFFFKNFCTKQNVFICPMSICVSNMISFLLLNIKKMQTKVRWKK